MDVIDDTYLVQLDNLYNINFRQNFAVRIKSFFARDYFDAVVYKELLTVVLEINFKERKIVKRSSSNNIQY